MGIVVILKYFQFHVILCFTMLILYASYATAQRIHTKSTMQNHKNLRPNRCRNVKIASLKKLLCWFLFHMIACFTMLVLYAGHATVWRIYKNQHIKNREQSHASRGRNVLIIMLKKLLFYFSVSYDCVFHDDAVK